MQFCCRAFFSFREIFVPNDSRKICIWIIGGRKEGLIVFLAIGISFLPIKSSRRDFHFTCRYNVSQRSTDFVAGIEYFSIPNSFVFYFYLSYTYTLPFFCSTFTATIGNGHRPLLWTETRLTHVGLCFQPCFSKIESRAETPRVIYLIHTKQCLDCN